MLKIIYFFLSLFLCFFLSLHYFLSFFLFFIFLLLYLSAFLSYKLQQINGFCECNEGSKQRPRNLRGSHFRWMDAGQPRSRSGSDPTAVKVQIPGSKTFQGEEKGQVLLSRLDWLNSTQLGSGTS